MGSVWATGSWAASCWAVGTWADAVIELGYGSRGLLLKVYS